MKKTEHVLKSMQFAIDLHGLILNDAQNKQAILSIMDFFCDKYDDFLSELGCLVAKIDDDISLLQINQVKYRYQLWRFGLEKVSQMHNSSKLNFKSLTTTIKDNLQSGDRLASQNTFDLWMNVMNQILALEIACADFNQKDHHVILKYYDYILNLKNPDKTLHDILFVFLHKYSPTFPQETFDVSMNILKANSTLNIIEKLRANYRYIASADNPIETNIDCCPICGGVGAAYFSANSFIVPYFTVPFKLWLKCDSCNNMYSNSIRKSYLDLSNNNHITYPNLKNNLSCHIDKHILLNWNSILKKIVNYTKGTKLLEVGVGTGALISVALELGYKVNAVEISNDAAQRISDLLNVEIYCCDFLKYETNQKYSIITMGDVIEHLTSPLKALQKAYDLLADDGMLWISTPNYESSFSRLMKFNDAMWTEPGHISYFNFHGLKKLLEKCNFEVVDYTVSIRYSGCMELIAKKR